MFKENEIAGLREMFESLGESQDSIHSVYGGQTYQGFQKSPGNPIGQNQFLQAGAMQPSLGLVPQISYPNSYFHPSMPVVQYQQAVTPVHPGMVYYAQNPPSSRDPRLNGLAVFGHPQSAEPYFSEGRRVGSNYHPLDGYQPVPPLPYKEAASRSQPARRRSLSESGSSDSEDAQELSEKVLKSSDAPGALNNLFNKSHKRHFRRHRSEARAVSAGSLLEELTSYRRRPDEDRERFDRRERVDKSEWRGGGRRDKRSERSERFEPKLRASEIRAEKKSGRSEGRKGAKHQSGRSDAKRGERGEKWNGPRISDEIPAALDESWFEAEREEEVRASRSEEPRMHASQSEGPHANRRRSKSHKPPPARTLTTRTSQNLAIVPASRRQRAPRQSIPHKAQTWWNPNSVLTGKRQRLPVLDWRKGEKYIAAPDGTVIGKEGFDKLVFDDTTRWKRKQRRSVEGDTTATEDGAGPRVRRSVSKDRRVSRDRHVSKEHRVTKEHRVSKEQRGTKEHRVTKKQKPAPRIRDDSSNDNSIRINDLPDLENLPLVVGHQPIINALDCMEKDQRGIFCLRGFKVLHRRSDRSWDHTHKDNGFFIAQSIAVRGLCISEVSLNVNMPIAKSEKVGADSMVYLRVTAAEANSVRVHVNEDEHLLSAHDEICIFANSTYAVTNLSSTKMAALSVVILRDDDQF